METLFPQLSEKDANQINMLALAHVGDAVYELLVRSMLCREKNAPVMQLHRLTVEHVRAEAQAERAQHQGKRRAPSRGHRTVPRRHRARSPLRLAVSDGEDKAHRRTLHRHYGGMTHAA